MRTPLGPGALRAALLLPWCALPGCAAPHAVDPGAERVVYYSSDDPDTVRQEVVYQGLGGAVLGAVSHQQRRDTALVYLHGIESHAGWFDHAADLLAASGFDVFCLDRRGSGINRENRGFPSGDVERYEVYLADIHAFVAPLRERYRRVYLVGLSWGGKLAVAHALTHPGDCDGLVLITPGLRSRVDLSAAQKVKAVAAKLLAPCTAIPIPIEPEMFTETPEFLDKMRRDPLSLHEVSARFFLHSHNLETFVDREMPRNELPILLILAGKDRIIDNEGVREVLARGRQELEVLTYEDQTHSIQFDAPERLVADIARWVGERR